MVRRVFLIVSLVSVLAFSFSFSFKSGAFKNIDAREAYRLQQKGAVLIDVRTKKEFERGHAKGAVHIPIYEEKHGKAEFNKDFVAQVEYLVKDDYEKPIVLICRSGHRSATAAELLSKNGFSEVYNVLHGFLTPGGWLYYKLPAER